MSTANAPAARMPSYPKLILTLAVIVSAVYYPVKILVSVQILPAEPAAAASHADPAPPAYRLFDEYPHVVADQQSNPAETTSAVWVSFRHLPSDEQAAALAPWKKATHLHPLKADGLYRLECQRAVVGDLDRLLARYPYAVAPGERTDPILTVAYRRAAGTSRFRVCVVRGDWLTAAFAADPPAAARVGLAASPATADRYLDATIPSDAVLAAFPAESRGLAVAPPTVVTRRGLETADASGRSLFVRWATATGAGVPAY
jgi:hypothetical protein